MAVIDWAKEAANITDTSGLFGSLDSVLDTKNILPQKEKDNSRPEADFRTGYWLEGNTIVFSTYVYNATSYSDEIIQALMKKAIALQKSLGNETYSFDFRINWVSKPRYDYSRTYRSYTGTNPKISAYTPKDRQSVDKAELLWVTNDNELPTEYYMELFDDNPLAGADGGTHPNKDNKLKSCSNKSQCLLHCLDSFGLHKIVIS